MRTILDVKLSSEKTVIVAAEDDVEDVLDHNKMLRSLPQKSDWGRHVASIPSIILVKWLNEAWNRGHNIRILSREWDELVSRKLRDPDWAYLKVDK